MRFDRPAILLTLINAAIATQILGPRDVQERGANISSSFAITRTSTSWSYSLTTNTTPVNASSTLSPPITAFSPHTQPSASSIIGPASRPDLRSSSSNSSNTSAPYASPNVLMSVSSEIGPAWGPLQTTSGGSISSRSSGAQLPGLNVGTTATAIDCSNGGDGAQATGLPDSLRSESGSTYNIAQATTGFDGRASTATSITCPIAVPSGQATQGDSDGAAHTILEQSALPHGQATIITTIISLVAPMPSADQEVPVAGQTSQTDHSSSGTYIVGADTTLAAGEPAASGSYSVTINGESQLQVITGASTTVIRSSETASSNRPQGTGSAVTSVAPETASGQVWWNVLPLAVICLGMILP